MPATSTRCCRNIKFENCTRRYLADYVKEINFNACRPCSTIIFSRFNQSGHRFWYLRCRCRRRLLNSVILFTRKRKRVFLSLSIKNQTSYFIRQQIRKSRTFPRAKVSTDTTRAVVQTRHSEGLKRGMWLIANVTVANRQLAATGLKPNGAGLECLYRNETPRTVFAGSTCLIRSPYRQKHYSVYVTVTHCYPRRQL